MPIDAPVRLIKFQYHIIFNLANHFRLLAMHSLVQDVRVNATIRSFTSDLHGTGITDAVPVGFGEGAAQVDFA